MIRINLSGAKKEIKAAAGPSVSLEGAKLAVFALGFAVLGLLVVGYRYYSLDKAGRDLDQEIKVAESEKAKLAAVKAQYEDQERAKKDLSRRIDIIEGLKRGQTGPVDMLNQMASAVQASKTLWLTTFDNNGNRINLTGLAVSVNAVADFINNLKRSGYFTNVEIQEVFQSEATGPVTTFQFTLSTEMIPGGAPAQAAAPGPAKPKT